MKRMLGFVFISLILCSSVILAQKDMTSQQMPAKQKAEFTAEVRRLGDDIEKVFHAELSYLTSEFGYVTVLKTTLSDDTITYWVSFSKSKPVKSGKEIMFPAHTLHFYLNKKDRNIVFTNMSYTSKKYKEDIGENDHFKYKNRLIMTFKSSCCMDIEPVK